jgi:hypothetical protein
VSEQLVSVELQEFERVQATAGTALLRVAARQSERSAWRPPTLVIDDGERPTG